MKASSNSMQMYFFCDTLCFCEPVETFQDSNTSLLLADGEIINQIKMTNLALADIKELLKQQVGINCLVAVFKRRWKRWIYFKSTERSDCHSTGVLQIKEIEFLKNTVMECEACGECGCCGRQTLAPPLTSKESRRVDYLCFQVWGGSTSVRPACPTLATRGWSVWRRLRGCSVGRVLRACRATVATAQMWTRWTQRENKRRGVQKTYKWK